MSKNHLKAAVVGGLIVFIWSFLSWMVFPWHQKCLGKFTNQSEVASVIANNAPHSGVYVLPNTFSHKEGTSHHEMQQAQKMMQNGPYMFASVKLEGVGKMTVKPFIFSLVIQIVGAFIVIWMLMQTKGLTFRQRVGFVTLFGFAVAFLSQLPEWNWWGLPFGHVVINMADFVIGWFLAGLAIVKMLPHHHHKK